MDIVYHEDQQLIEKLQSGSEAAFDHIYDLCWKPLFQYAYKRLRSEDNAKDIVQEVFIALWNKKDTLKLTSSLSSYLFSILRFKLIDHYHAGIVQEKHVLSLIREKDGDSHNDTDQKVYTNEINGLLNLSVESLPHKMKEVFRLSRIHGYSVKQISRQLSISEQTVKNQLTTALKRLKLTFTDYLTIFFIYCLFK